MVRERRPTGDRDPREEVTGVEEKKKKREREVCLSVLMYENKF